MSLEQGTRFGPYEIVAPLGAGGMGEVYKARDTRLDRTVAIKVLPSHIAQREDLRARFEREARAVSSLKHPNICSLFDVGQQDGIDFMVMEHLEGETLADRLQRGPLSLDDALKYAMQIAEAVDRAHRSGVVHRDLKPANVMLTRDGAKVLDFGLAKTAVRAAAAPDVTLTHALTSEGTVLGTPQYMSPEQIEGREADARTDIFAFGCLLYESVTGKRAFDGKTKASVIGAILSADPPPITSLVAVAPSRLDAVVRRCLVKDPEERYQSLWDVLIELQSVRETPAPGVRRRPPLLPWILSGAFAVALATLAMVHLREASPIVDSVRFHVDPPEDSRAAPVISPDGHTIAIAAQRRLWIRHLGSLEFKPIEGVQDPSYPFWSPDSTSIGFFSEDKLKTVSLNGGVTTICDAPGGRGGAWSQHGVIIFAAAFQSGIRRVPASGGVPEAITTIDDKGTQDSHRYPSFLPDGRHFLFGYLSRDPAKAGIYVASIDRGTPIRLRPDSLHAVYGAAQADGRGFLLFRRDQTLMAQSFDTGSFKLTGAPVPVAEQTRGGGNTGSGAFSVSRTGTLAYWSGGAAVQDLGLFDRSGNRVGTFVERTTLDTFAWSPDGRTLAAGHMDRSRIDNHLWLHDVKGAAASRFTFGPPPGWTAPVWSPDGRQIVYATTPLAGLPAYEIRRKSRDMTGGEETLMRSDSILIPQDWSPDGKWLSYNSKGDLWLLPMQPRGEAIPFAPTPATEGKGQFSPDGKWIAYVSDETGSEDVFVQPFPATGAKWQMSVNGGNWPKWRKDGTELFFTSPDLTLMAVQVRLGQGTLEHSPPQPLFTNAGLQPTLSLRYSYAPAPDGQRFLVRVPSAGEKPPPITVVLNWQASLPK